MSQDGVDNLNNAYAERNQAAMLAAALAERAGLKVGWGLDPEEPNWPVLFIDLPGVGQVSWHVPAQEATQFPIGPYAGEWDGHGASEKRRRIVQFLLDTEQASVPRLVE